MNKFTTVVSVISATLGCAVGIISGCTPSEETSPGYAEVINIEEIKEIIETPREVCEDVTVTKKVQPKDDKQIAGTATGAVVGGVLGHQVGGGSGKTLANIAGTVAGGYAGKKLQEKSQDQKTETTTETKCHTVTDTEEKIVGYNVTYMIGGQEGSTRLDKKHGNRIPVEDEQLVIE